MKFNAPGFDDHPSGEKDEAILKFIFTLLGFDVRVHQNLTAAEIISTAAKYSAMEHKGAFFFIILSHGGAGSIVFGTDGRGPAVYELEKLFHATNCPSLAGIPTVFIIDGCRRIPVKCTTQTNETMPQSSKKFDTGPADIMTIFASAQGTMAHQDKTEGSIFTLTFVDVFDKVSADKSLTDIVKKVTKINKVLGVQIPQIQSTFCNNYYITRYVFITWGCPKI